MEVKDYIDKIKFQLTGGIIDCELDDKGIEKVINMSLEEMNRYYNVTNFIQVPASSCIDVVEYPQIESIVGVHRISGTSSSSTDSSTSTDPAYISQLQMYNISSNYYTNDWVYRMLNWSTAQQIANTTSTDLDFRYDEINKKLYVNYSQGKPAEVVIEFVPKLHDASEVVTNFWQDILLKLSLAHAKIILGRIRTRYTQSNALWEEDGATLLEEGNSELTTLREQLRVATDLVLPLD